MDIALAIERILPAAEYLGSVTDNTELSWYDTIWTDPRIDKPSWNDLKVAYTTLSAQNSIAELTQTLISQLVEIDNKSIRPLRALAFNDITEEDKKRLIELREQAIQLREELNSLLKQSESNAAT